jgi:hypothetical protein
VLDIAALRSSVFTENLRRPGNAADGGPQRRPLGGKKRA